MNAKQTAARPIRSLPLHEALGIPKNAKGYKYGTQDILALLIAMKYFSQPDRYNRLINKVNYALNKKLASRLHTIPSEDIRNIMGLVGDWQKLAELKIQSDS